MARSAVLVPLLVVALFASGLLATGLEEPRFVLPQVQEKDGGRQPTFEWAVEEVPASGDIVVYRVGQAMLGPLDAARLGRAFDMPVTAAPQVDWDGSADNSYLRLEHDGRMLTMSTREGRWSYQDEAIGRLGQENESTYPDDGAAVAVVHEFLVEKGLAPEGLDRAAGFVDEPGRSQGTCGPSGCTMVALGKWVSFARAVDGHPTFGGGDVLRVAIDPDGAVVDAKHTWSELHRSHEVAFVAFEAARERVDAGEAIVEAPHACSAARLESVHVAYYVPSPTSGEDWAFPVYAFGGPCLDDATSGSVTVYVSGVA